MIQMMTAEKWSQLAGLTFIWTMVWQYITDPFRGYFKRYKQKIASFMDPYVHITFDELCEDRYRRSKAYSAIKLYLCDKSSIQAKRLKADIVDNNKALVLSMDNGEEITDEFEGANLWWSFQQIDSARDSESTRSFILTFHKWHRKLIVGSYLDYVVEEGKAIGFRRRQRKLYTNNADCRNRWSYEVFKHPATFQTLAMEQRKKEDIIKDLDAFTKGKDYYSRIGKPWKRGYLLYGPPGTGKSTMIAAMANYLNYDVYDLELTAVKSNVELRRLLTETTDKSIIVIEDIDCSLSLTGQREKDNRDRAEEKEYENDSTRKHGKKEKGKGKGSDVTLSGLLNTIDGLWSACEGERFIVFTTNYVEKLDPALIRRGRMDKHIDLSYCTFEAFKVLAKNYLKLDAHPLFATIESLLKETKMTPADVGENLMYKSVEEDAEISLLNLIEALGIAKQNGNKGEEGKESSEKDDRSNRRSCAKEGERWELGKIHENKHESIWLQFRKAEWGW